MKKTLPALAGGFASVSAFAEGAAITTPDGILTSAQTALSSLMTTALPIVGAIVVSGLTLWGVFKLLRLVMKSFGFGTR